MVNFNQRGIYALLYANRFVNRGANVVYRPQYELPGLPSIDFEVHGRYKVKLYIVVDFHGEMPYREMWKSLKALKLAKKQKLDAGEKREIESVVGIINPTFKNLDELVSRLGDEEFFEHSHLGG